MSTATEQQSLAESFVHRAMTADREKLEALFAEALGHATALTQENQRLRSALKQIVAADDEAIAELKSRGLVDVGYVPVIANIAREALNPKSDWKSDSVSQAKYQKLYGALEDLASCQPEADMDGWRRARDVASEMLYGKSDTATKP